MTIGKRIKARREELGLTQRELAAKMGYTDHTTITRIESGRTDPPQTRVAQFAKVLGVTPGHLMGWDAEPEDLGAIAARVLQEPGTLKMVQDFLMLDEADRNTVQALVASLAAKIKKD